MDLVMDFVLSGFNEPVHVPGPEDEPILLPVPEPGFHGNMASSATPLLLDEEVMGTIDPHSDVDFFSFEAEADQAYSITVDLETLGGSELTLYDTDGASELAYNDDYGNTAGSQIVWAAPRTGTYYVVVEGYSGEETGSYGIELNTWSGPVPTPGRTPAQSQEWDIVRPP